jgi:hypothetical protein
MPQAGEASGDDTEEEPAGVVRDYLVSTWNGMIKEGWHSGPRAEPAEPSDLSAGTGGTAGGTAAAAAAAPHNKQQAGRKRAQPDSSFQDIAHQPCGPQQRRDEASSPPCAAPPPAAAAPAHLPPPTAQAAEHAAHLRAALEAVMERRLTARLAEVQAAFRGEVGEVWAAVRATGDARSITSLFAQEEGDLREEEVAALTARVGDAEAVAAAALARAAALEARLAAAEAALSGPAGVGAVSRQVGAAEAALEHMQRRVAAMEHAASCHLSMLLSLNRQHFDLRAEHEHLAGATQAVRASTPVDPAHSVERIMAEPHRRAGDQEASSCEGPALGRRGGDA